MWGAWFALTWGFAFIAPLLLVTGATLLLVDARGRTAAWLVLSGAFLVAGLVGVLVGEVLGDHSSSGFAGFVAVLALLALAAVVAATKLRRLVRVNGRQ
jgi:hypothetical protein